MRRTRIHKGSINKKNEAELTGVIPTAPRFPAKPVKVPLKIRPKPSATAIKNVLGTSRRPKLNPLDIQNLAKRRAGHLPGNDSRKEIFPEKKAESLLRFPENPNKLGKTLLPTPPASGGGPRRSPRRRPPGGALLTSPGGGGGGGGGGNDAPLPSSAARPGGGGGGSGGGGEDGGEEEGGKEEKRERCEEGRVASALSRLVMDGNGGGGSGEGAGGRAGGGEEGGEGEGGGAGGSGPALGRVCSWDSVDAENHLLRRKRAATVAKAKKMLQEVARARCGTAAKFYRLFDVDGDEAIGFEEFSRGIAMYNLDGLFPRAVQALIFEEIDTDKSGSIELPEMEAFLELGHATAKPVRPSRLPSPIEDRATQELRVKMSKLMRRRLGPGSMGQNLIRLFRRLDTDDSGFLEPWELRRALAPDHLNLGLEDREVKQAVQAMSVHGDGLISFKEFFRWFQYDYNEPMYNLVHDGRARTLRELQGQISHMKDPEEYEEERGRRRRAEELDAHWRRTTERALEGAAAVPHLFSPVRACMTLDPGTHAEEASKGYPNLRHQTEGPANPAFFKRPVNQALAKHDIQVNTNNQAEAEARLRPRARDAGEVFRGVRAQQGQARLDGLRARRRWQEDRLQNTWPSVALGDAGVVAPAWRAPPGAAARFTTSTQAYHGDDPSKQKPPLDEEQQKRDLTHRFREESQQLHGEHLRLRAALLEDKRDHYLARKRKVRAQALAGYLERAEQRDMWAARALSDDAGPRRHNLEMQNRIFGSSIVT